MIISCITTASNKAVFIKGIPFRIVQIKGFVVNTETNQVLYICINRLYYDVEKSDTLYYFSINTDNRFDNPIYFAIGYGKSSAILSVKELIEFAEQGNKGEETISVPGLYTENKIYINTAAVFGIKGLLLTQKGHAGVSNLNLGELKKVLKKLEDRK